MFEHGLSLGATSGLIAATAYLALAISVVWAQGKPGVPRGLISWVFVLALLSTVVWATLEMASQQALLPRRSWVLSVGLPIADAVRYAAWFAVLLGVLNGRVASVFGCGPWALWLITGLAVTGPMGLVLVREALDFPLLSFERGQAFAALGMAVVGLILSEQVLRNASGDMRWGVKPLLLGLGAVFVFDLFVFSQAALFQEFDSDALSIRAAVHAAAVPLLWMASRRNLQWTTRLHVSRAAVFHSAALLLVGSYLLMVAAVGYYVRYTGGEWGRALQQALTVVAMVLLLLVALSGSVRARLRVYISKNFFSYRYDYREEWLRFTAMLASSGSPNQLGELVVRGLANLVESPAGALWLKRGGDAAFIQSARWNLAEEREVLEKDCSLANFLRERAWIVDLDEWRELPGKYLGLSIPAHLHEDAKHWLIVPLMASTELVGFAILAKPRTSIELNWEVRDLLRTASSQAASYLMQMQATEALLEARKFEAFNRMSAFVVHDLKNIVTQLSLMLKNAKRLRDNPEFQQDMLDTVENSLEKMRQLMLQLREGAKPHGVTGGVDLVAIARSLARNAEHKGRALELQVAGPLSTRGHEDRIERVIGHVVQNALDATPPHGRVWLKLDQSGSHARVEVGDTGCGMTPEFIENRLFKPFQTTKSTGMGIGAYESFQYLQELGGKMDVESKVNVGTRITIWLPLFHGRQGADLDLSAAR
ncbi:PEP-CTERM system histidine kinase PrsK [Paucibacter sediminis]|uniref:histidine kinase n=1 Tax=Paucibacter sediminis TaxID=3019553 RepID=A0AA95SMF6_9BURK|nr:XrtA/PEP-CTERM system histidine kinase PrsK [Paucibacter sp. S2-9]WIT11362.1 PEP-CTERM system histidine kinase PrsK [Paucibacter sp. S2-9]